MKISLGEKLTIASFEELLFRYSTASKRLTDLSFDLTALDWAGYYPSVLFFSWAATLLRSPGTSISLLLPPRDNLPPTVHKIFLDYNILHTLRDLGANVPYHSAPLPSRGLPLRLIPDTIITKIKSGEFVSLNTFVTPTEVPLGAARDTLEVVLRELAENACWHGDSQLPYFGIALSEATGPLQSPRRSRGVISPHPPLTAIAEIVFGDLGPGINRLLEPHLPADYIPIFQDPKHKYKKDEKVVALGFEFSSTSDEPAREDRIRRLLSRSDLHPSEIASGLFCIIEIVRTQRGQIVIRSPKSILSFDFKDSTETPRISGAREIGRKSLGNLPGTHFLIRIPLNSPRKNTLSISIEQSKALHLPVADTHVLDVFPDTLEGDWGRRLHLTLGRIDSALTRFRTRRGTLIIPPLAETLPTRVAALLFFALKSMNHGLRTIVWLNQGTNLSLAHSVASQIDTAQRIPLDSTRLLIGDIHLNRFFLSPAMTDDQRIEISSQSLIAIREAYGTYLHRSLQRRLQDPSVRMISGPFLLPGQYYTRIFYHIGNALLDIETRRQLAEWCLQNFREDPEILIGSSEILAPLIEEVNQRLGELEKHPAKEIYFRKELGTPGNVAATMALSGKRAVVITDVICKGRSLQRLLNDMGMIDITQILTVVDARSELELGKPVTLGFENSSKLVDLQSIVSESIEPLHDPPRIEGDAGDDAAQERVYVIDEKTNAPTLYVRPITPELSFDRLLDGAVSESRCLISGHSEYANRHYLYFLDLPKLFSSLRDEIGHWIQKQLSYVDRAARTPTNTPWNALIYNQDQSLGWVRAELSKIHQKMHSRLIDLDHLQAPEPPTPDAPGGKWLVLIPAMESGEVARKCIELASRRLPAEILFLCVVSRMRADHLSFMSGITEYRNSSLHTAFFIHLPISAYGISPSICPVCKDLYELDRLASTAEELKADSLLHVIERKIKADQPLRLDNLPEGEDDHRSTSRDTIRAKLRGLYEAAGTDIEYGRQINQLFNEDSGNVDRMIELISVERNAAEFTLFHLEKRLYKGMDTIYGRLDQLLWEVNPPYPLGRAIGAFLHLMPLSFASAAGNLIDRFRSSRRDVEEILLGLLRLRLQLPESGEIMSSLREAGDTDLAGLVGQAVSVVSSLQARDEEAFDSALTALPELWSRFARSNPFATGLDAISSTRVRGDSSILLHVREMLASWNDDISSLISSFTSSPVWSYLSRRDGEFASSMGRIDRSMARLSLLYRLFLSDRDLVAEERMIAIGEDLRDAVNDVRAHISGMLVNPVRCSIFRLENEIRATDGSVLHFEKIVDHNVSIVFCDKQELETAISEIFDNWRKHKTKSRTGDKVTARIFESQNEVVLEFGDNIEGDFDLTSEGGIKTVKRFGRHFGVDVDFTTRDHTGYKYVRLAFRPIQVGL